MFTTIAVLRPVRAVAGLVAVGAALLLGVALPSAAGAGSATGAVDTGYSVTFVARSCPTYGDVFANTARNNIMESLQDLGPDSQYLQTPNLLINPTSEQEYPQSRCTSLPGWRFTMGPSYATKVDDGPWGSMSAVTRPYPTSIVTRESTPLLDQAGHPVAGQTLAGAVTVALTRAQLAQAQTGSLWVQGGAPGDPVNVASFPGPEYGFAALRCATDNVNGDNVEYVAFPTGITHVFCFAYYVTPPPTAGTITIVKQVTGAPAGTDPAFPFTGDISYDPGGFTLAGGGQLTFVRAGGRTWQATESPVEGYRLTSIDCSAVTAAGTPGRSTATPSGTTISIDLVAGEHVTCAFHNAAVPATGGLTIEKITRGGVGTFAFSVVPSGGGDGHRLTAVTDAPGVPAAATPSLDDLSPGIYVVRERSSAAAHGRWRPVAAICDGTRQDPRRPVTVTVTAGTRSTCTFVNRLIPAGAISVTKSTVGAAGTTGFVIESRQAPVSQYVQQATTGADGAPAAATPATAADATDALALGSYTITDLPPTVSGTDAWTLTAVICNGEAVPFSAGSVEVRLTRRVARVHCAFTNTFTPGPDTVIPPPPIPQPPAPVTPGQPDISAPDEGGSVAAGQSLANLVLAKRASTTVALRGHPLAYTLTVHNAGPDAATRVVLSDAPQTGLRLLSVAVAGGPRRCRIAGGLSCSLGTIRSGATVTVAVRAVGWRVAARLVNRAVVGTATRERTLADNVARAAVRVVAPLPTPVTGRG